MVGLASEHRPNTTVTENPNPPDYVVTEEKAHNVVTEQRKRIEDERIQRIYDALLNRRDVEILVVPPSTLVHHTDYSNSKERQVLTEAHSQCVFSDSGDAEKQLLFVSKTNRGNALLEETLHVAINDTYQSDGKPFVIRHKTKSGLDRPYSNFLWSRDPKAFSASEEKQDFITALREDLKVLNDPRPFLPLQNDLHMPKEDYSFRTYYAEIPAKILTQMGTGEWKTELQQKYPRLTTFCNKLLDTLVEKLAEERTPAWKQQTRPPPMRR